MLLPLSGVLILFGIAQSQPDSTSKSAPDQLLKKINPKEAQTLIKDDAANPNLVILDVRTPKEFAEEHIENATMLDFRSSSFGNDLDKLDKNKTYIVYCRLGHRSGRTLDLMKKKQFKAVYDIEGGITQWKKDGLPVKK